VCIATSAARGRPARWLAAPPSTISGFHFSLPLGAIPPFPVAILRCNMSRSTRASTGSCTACEARQQGLCPFAAPPLCRTSTAAFKPRQVNHLCLPGPLSWQHSSVRDRQWRCCGPLCSMRGSSGGGAAAAAITLGAHWASAACHYAHSGAEGAQHCAVPLPRPSVLIEALPCPSVLIEGTRDPGEGHQAEILSFLGGRSSEPTPPDAPWREVSQNRTCSPLPLPGWLQPPSPRPSPPRALPTTSVRGWQCGQDCPLHL
jgi:hypothetical protein